MCAFSEHVDFCINHGELKKPDNQDEPKAKGYANNGGIRCIIITI